MDNVLASLESKLSPMAMASSTSSALSNGAINHAATLVETFASEESETTKVVVLRQMATDYGLTCDEFAKSCKRAQELASAIDQGNGFIESDEVRYGPKRRLLNQRLSEAKQIFGVAKVAPSVVAEKGYWPALEAARSYLANKGLKWDARPVLNAAEKQANKASKELKQDMQAAMLANPMVAGESISSYMLRLTEQVSAVEAEKNAHEAKAKELASTLKAEYADILPLLIKFLQAD